MGPIDFVIIINAEIAIKVLHLPFSLLPAHNFQEAACTQAIENLTECCRKWKHKSLVCSGMLVAEEGKSDVGAETAPT